MTITPPRTYNELRKLQSFMERYDYLHLRSHIGTPTFGFDRYLNQILYRSYRWKKLRDEIIVRDKGFDLGTEGCEIEGLIIVHHMNPITMEDIETESEKVFNPQNLISCSSKTHLAIHFGDESLLPKPPVIRYPGDTTPWR